MESPRKQKRNSPRVPKSSLLGLTQWRADSHCNDDIVGILRIEIGRHGHLETMSGNVWTYTLRRAPHLNVGWRGLWVCLNSAWSGRLVWNSHDPAGHCELLAALQ